MESSFELQLVMILTILFVSMTCKHSYYFQTGKREVLAEVGELMNEELIMLGHLFV